MVQNFNFFARQKQELPVKIAGMAGLTIMEKLLTHSVRFRRKSDPLPLPQTQC